MATSNERRRRVGVSKLSQGLSREVTDLTKQNKKKEEKDSGLKKKRKKENRKKRKGDRLGGERLCTRQQRSYSLSTCYMLKWLCVLQLQKQTSPAVFTWGLWYILKFLTTDSQCYAAKPETSLTYVYVVDLGIKKNLSILFSPGFPSWL